MSEQSDHRLVAQIVGMQSSIAALARIILVNLGSDAFVHAEAEAIQFARASAEIDGEFGERVAEKAEAVVRDIFGKVDAA